MVGQRRVRPLSQDQFFELNSGKLTYEVFAEKVYLMIHSYYLKEGIKIRIELGKNWEKEFGISMTDETFEYMLVNEPVILRNVIIDQTKQKNEITSAKYLEKTIVALEFDLWMIERYQKGLSLSLSIFESYLSEKYGRFLQERYRFFKKFDLRYINRFQNLAKELQPLYPKILEIFNLILSNNKMRVEIDNPSVERTKEYKIVSLKTNINEKIQERNSRLKPDGNKDQSMGQESAASISAAQNREREYMIILKEREERIEKLEKDIKEYKRQRDESREYSANQYDRGIKDLFSVLNDARYGKIIDYFYSLLKAEDTDDNLTSYLDNFFMALEDMEIEPIAAEEKVAVDEDSMIKQYNLDFDKSEYDASKVRLKYAGWKYKDIPMEKPTLTLKEK